MTTFSIEYDGWLDSHEVDEEAATFTRLRLRVGDVVLTRNYSKRGGGQSDAINVPLLPLATKLAEDWWALLYEPLRRSEDPRFQVRHRLDAVMHGYVFPAVAICSGGDDAVLIDWDAQETEHSPIEFRAARPAAPAQLSRETLENTLLDLIERVIERRSGARRFSKLQDAWGRLKESMEDPELRAYCVSAGRLGLDPFDENGPDLSAFASNISPEMFDDISDAADVSEMPAATDWARRASKRIVGCPRIDLSSYGPPPTDDLNTPPWVMGANAARKLRKKLSLSDNPKRAVAELVGSAVAKGLSKEGPPSVTALVQRIDGHANIGPIASSSRRRRFRACSAAYLAWTSKPGEERAATIAATRRQQASRAFAAEMLSPVNFLQERAANKALTDEDIEKFAGELIAPHETVLRQAVQAGIPLRGVEFPVSSYGGLFSRDALTLA